MPAEDRLKRRDFLQQGGAVVAATGLASLGTMNLTADDHRPGKRFKKAVKIDMVKIDGSLIDKLKLLKELGFDGVELNSPGGPSPEEAAKAQAESGLPVHGAVDSIHWRQRLSDPDPEVRAQGVRGLKTAIEMSKAYGGSSVLLVPGRVTEDASYDQCWKRSIAEIRKVLPLAEELGIHVLIENVWNDFLTRPQQMADFLDEIDSKMVGAYFDVGNTVRYSPPHEWIPILGKRIVKLDIKDYSHKTRFEAKLLEGDVQWTKVMAALGKIGYSGWATAEIPGGARARLAEIAMRMDKIFAI